MVAAVAVDALLTPDPGVLMLTPWPIAVPRIWAISDHWDAQGAGLLLDIPPSLPIG